MTQGSIRLIAASEEEALQLVTLLEQVTHGAVRFTSPRRGRKGSEWLAYGTVATEAQPEQRNGCTPTPQD